MESHGQDFGLAAASPACFGNISMKNRELNPAYALALCYAGMVCLAIAVNLMPIFLTTLRVDLGGRAGLTGEQLGRISAITFSGWRYSLHWPLGRSMGREAIQRPRNPVDWCWTRALGHLTRLFHGFGCSIHHGSRSWDSRHGAQSHRCRSPARQPRDGLELVAFFLWHRDCGHGPRGYARIFD